VSLVTSKVLQVTLGGRCSPGEQDSSIRVGSPAQLRGRSVGDLRPPDPAQFSTATADAGNAMMWR